MKKLQSFIAILLMLLIVFSVDNVSAAIAGNQTTDDSDTTIIDEEVFPHDEVIDVNIEIDEDIYEEMINNAADEEYVLANITYNGYTFNNIAIRPKGNSSLRDVAKSDGDRFSFKIDFNKYVDGQNLFGITKLNLNNLFSDDTLMAEYIGYDMLENIEAVASNTTYTSLSINGEYFGLYIAVEAVDERFLEENYGNFDGQLYKPDMGVGSDLAYISDDPDDYSGIFPQNDDMNTDESFIELVKTIDEIIKNDGETEEYNLSNILNVDSFLKYLAFSTATVHLDAYQSGMSHNYYLYFNTDTEKFEWISWDLNMIFNNFPQSGLSDEEATQFLIDEPVMGELSKYPLVQAVLTNADYVESYHEYLLELLNNSMSEEIFEQSVIETFAMIEPYASVDPSAFYTTDQAKISIFENDEQSDIVSLLEFFSLRVENINQQITGEIASTNNGNGNTGTSGGMGGMGGKMQDDRTEGDIAEGNMPEGDMPQGDMAEGDMPERDMPQGDIPEGMDMANPPGITSTESSSVDITDIIAIAVSFALTGGLTIYLYFRKY
jgi:spore coat protein CotH